MRRLLPALALAVLAGCARAPVERVEWTTMGTIAAVQTRGAADPSAVETVKRSFENLEALLNAHNPESELSRLAPLPEGEILTMCDKAMRPCYETAFRLMRETDGAFNPRWRGPDKLDLGGIAKGFALDLAEAELRNGNKPLESGDVLLDLGGNIKICSGEWKVGIYAPEDAGAMETISLTSGCACATSAEYARGKHIYDGRTGLAVSNDLVSVTVVHPTSAMLADGLSTIMFIFGREEGEVFLKEHYPEAKAIWQVRR